MWKQRKQNGNCCITHRREFTVNEYDRTSRRFIHRARTAMDWPSPSTIYHRSLWANSLHWVWLIRTYAQKLVKKLLNKIKIPIPYTCSTYILLLFTYGFFCQNRHCPKPMNSQVSYGGPIDYLGTDDNSIKSAVYLCEVNTNNKDHAGHQLSNCDLEFTCEKSPFWVKTGAPPENSGWKLPKDGRD